MHRVLEETTQPFCETDWPERHREQAHLVHDAPQAPDVVFGRRTVSTNVPGDEMDRHTVTTEGLQPPPHVCPAPGDDWVWNLIAHYGQAHSTHFADVLQATSGRAVEQRPGERRVNKVNHQAATGRAAA